MPELIVVLERDEIDRRVARMAARISADYRDRELVCVAILKGAFIFMADLMRRLTIPVRIDFLRAASYGNGTASSGALSLMADIGVDIAGKDVLVVEDIVDSGFTLSRIVEHLKAKGAESVRVCAMIDKRERREVDVVVDYACHVVEQGFLVGYGMDYAERYRELPAVYHLKF